MSDTVMNLLKLIEEEYSLNEITEKMNLSRDQLYSIFRDLRSIGMNFNKKYYGNGDIIYLPKNEIEIPSKIKSVNVITSPESNNIRVLLLSDLHMGSIYERLDALNTMFDYCIVEGIHIIIIPGDLVDGINIGRSECKLIKDPIKQMEHVAKNYPEDPNIISFFTSGNHDIDLLTSCGINFSTYLENFRHDIVPVGYGYGIINIKNDKIMVSHPLCIGISKDLDLTSNYLLIKGHHHHVRSIIGSNGNCSLNVPSLSSIYLTDNEFLPGAIDLNIKFKNGYFDTVYYEHLLVNNGKVCSISSTQFSITPSKDRKYDIPIKNVEDRAKIKVLNKK